VFLRQFRLFTKHWWCTCLLQLADGLHLIDFEQLKIENQTLNEKIEDRNEELSKLRKKLTQTVQVLTHVREKLQFVDADAESQSTHLAGLASEVAQHRDTVARKKLSREKLRVENEK
jgi:chromosome segregation ATPase